MAKQIGIQMFTTNAFPYADISVDEISLQQLALKENMIQQICIFLKGKNINLKPKQVNKNACCKFAKYNFWA